MRRRKGLSPLVASVILIAFTVIGGFIVYEYFLSSSGTMMAAGESIIMSVNSVRLSNTSMLIHISGVNGHNSPITISSIIYYDPTGTTNTIPLPSPLDVSPGEKFSINEVIPASATAVTIEYTTSTGETLTAPPASLS
ncbi:MAG: hypothetical protein F7C09_05170 [Aeropyrum sp.]|nr:hypothetical protein [Aeropyrum sp.]